MTKSKDQISVFWFRRDLRLEDNTGLYQALISGNPVLPLFIFDTNILEKLEDKKDKRVDLIYKILLHLNEKISSFNSTIRIVTGNPKDVFTRLLLEYEIRSVYTNADYEPYAIKRDNDVATLLKESNIDFFSFKDQVIFGPDEILKSDKSPYTVFTPYSKAWKNNLSLKKIFFYNSENYLFNLYKAPHSQFPDISETGFIATDFTFQTPVINRKIIANYAATRDYPAIIGTSGLSIHLRFGTVSIRKLVSIALELSNTWLNELIWREFFMNILFWFPYVENDPFKKKYNEINWRNNETEFEKWCKGETGYPLVDAGMRELNATGLIHNRVRMVTAGFLTKHLLIDWRWGEAYFASKLLDFDLSANNGNWQWAAGCGCDAVPYFRIFNPTEQLKRFDSDLKYVRKWIPELNSSEYPLPVVDHNFARLRALNTYKTALNQT